MILVSYQIRKNYETRRIFTMKKKKVSKKMALNKETISNFDNDQMNRVKGKGFCPPLCMCKVMTCRTCLQGTCTCSELNETNLFDCKIETIVDCPE